LNFSNNPKKFVDLEDGREITVKSENIKKQYREFAFQKISEIKSLAIKYKMDYSLVDVNQGYRKALNTYLLERRKIF